MAEKKVYIGSLGPFIYDDSESINDPDGDFAGENQVGLRADHTVKAPEFEGVPVSSLSVANIDDPSTELASLSSSTVGGLIFCYESVAGDIDKFTMYLWDTDISSVDIPYVVAGDGGYWIAVGGRYIAGDVTIKGNSSSNEDQIVCFNNEVVCHDNEVVYV